MKISPEPKEIRKICLDFWKFRSKIKHKDLPQIFAISTPYALKLSLKLGGITKNTIFGDFDLGEQERNVP